VLFGLIHAQLVLGARPDVDLIREGIGSAVLPPLAFDPEREALFFTHPPPWTGGPLRAVPVGLVFRAWPADAATPPPKGPAPPDELPGEDSRAVRADSMSRRLVGHFHLVLGLTELERGHLDAARGHLDRARAAASDDVVVVTNVGMAWASYGLYDEAVAALEAAERVDRRARTAAPDPDGPSSAAALRRERDRLASVVARLSATPAVREAPQEALRHARLADLLAARGEQRAATAQRLRAGAPSDATPGGGRD
jgi:tetratricopeptide (TPR) repeat protein